MPGRITQQSQRETRGATRLTRRGPDREHVPTPFAVVKAARIELAAEMNDASRSPEGGLQMNDTVTSSTTHLSPETVLAQMKKHGVTHVVWLPDSETNWLYLLMQAEPSLTLVAVPREGLAMSVASGLYAGGKKPLVLIQNTGLMESGDSIRGWLLGMEVPVVLMVGLRGWTRHGVTTDTAAVYTERFLNAFNINYYLVESDADAARIEVAFKEAENTKRPVAVLVGDEYHGFGSK
jgi:sulfopyruvate decarboxylase subunit alpha